MEKVEKPESTVRDYVLSFSSFYKAAYAQDMLKEKGINSSLKKLPTELISSCSTGLYLRTSSIQRVMAILSEKRIQTRGVFQIQREGRKKVRYIKIK